MFKSIKFWSEFAREEWADYKADCHFAQYSPESYGQPKKPSIIEFISILSRVLWNNFMCSMFGHVIVDDSTAGPDTGNMDHHCDRCGKCWEVTLY